MLLPFALIVTGCNGLGKGSIFNEKFMKRNFGEAVKQTHQIAEPEKFDLNFEEGVTPTETDQYDLFKVSKDGVVGYYNLLNKTYPVPLSVGITDNLKVTSTSTPATTQNPSVSLRVLSGTKEVDGNTVLLVFDDFGNKLYEGANGAVSLSASIMSRNEAEDKERTVLIVMVGGELKAVAFYNVDGSFKEVLTSDEFIKKFPYAQFGQSLADFGHKELSYKVVELETPLHVVYARRCAVYNTKKEKYVASFEIPGSAYYTIIGDNIIYQVSQNLPERAEKYDYSVNDDKFLIDTYSVSLATGKTKSVKTNFVLSESDDELNLANTKGIFKYKLFEQIKEIGKDKVLSEVERDVILDQNLKEKADVTGVDIADLVPFGDKYYVNLWYGFIYDSKLREVGRTRGTVISEPHLVRDGRYGLINHKGEYIEQPIYVDADAVGNDGHYALATETNWKFVKVTEKEKVELIKEISKDDYTLGGAFAKYIFATRKSDSKNVAFDVTNGQEIAIPEVAEGSEFRYSTIVDRFNSTVEAGMMVYKKDSTYTVILLKDNISVEYSFKK